MVMENPTFEVVVILTNVASVYAAVSHVDLRKVEVLLSLKDYHG